MVDEPKRSLADDPAFLASLSDLDEGVVDQGVSVPPAPRSARPPQPPKTAGAPAALPPLHIPPGTRRPLLDLFPPESGLPVSVRHDDALPPAPVRRDPPQAPPPARRDPPPPPAREITRQMAPETPREIPPPATREAASEPGYEAFYGLAEKPFTLSTDPKFLYHSAAHDEAAQTLLSAIGRRDALVVVTGDPGIGKTMLCRAVMEELDRRTLTSFVDDPFVSPEELLKTVLVDFGVVTRADRDAGRLERAQRGDLMAALREFLVSLGALQAFAVVFIDDAQHLSADLVQQVRLLTELQEDPRLLQVVLVGEPSLLTHLRRSEARPLEQRIAVKCRLGPLRADETVDYVTHRLRMAGARPGVSIDDEGGKRLYGLSRGVPRVINVLCERILTLGYEASASVIDGPLVQAAASDLDLGSSTPGVRRIARAAAIVAALALSALLGASLAAWMFRAPLSRLVAQWEQWPEPPHAPARTIAPAIQPLPAPDDAGVMRPRND